jgi:hypothetical protein
MVLMWLCLMCKEEQKGRIAMVCCDIALLEWKGGKLGKKDAEVHVEERPRDKLRVSSVQKSSNQKLLTDYAECEIP